MRGEDGDMIFKKQPTCADYTVWERIEKPPLGFTVEDDSVIRGWYFYGVLPEDVGDHYVSLTVNNRVVVRAALRSVLATHDNAAALMARFTQIEARLDALEGKTGGEEEEEKEPRFGSFPLVFLLRKNATVVIEVSASFESLRVVLFGLKKVPL